MDKTRILASFYKHAANPEVSTDHHVRARRIALGEWAVARKRIYLDQRFWVDLRKVVLGIRTDAESVSLLDVLRRRVANNEIICPISEPVFAELMKQQDLDTRRATAQLIDELSRGVCLGPEQERVGTELAHFLYPHGRQGTTYPLNVLVWSKLSYVLGIMHPSQTAFEPDQELLIQKALFDYMWNCSLTEMLDTLGRNSLPEITFDDLADKLNQGIAQHSGAIRSFEEVYRHEMAGALALVAATGVSILEDLFQKSHGLPPELSDSERGEHERQLHAFLVNVLTHKPSVRKQLPTLHVHALCHAALRWNKKQRIDGNDIYDFHHAAAAIPYCDAFFTDKPLQSLLQQNPLKIREDFACQIVSSFRDAVACASTL